MAFLLMTDKMVTCLDNAFEQRFNVREKKLVIVQNFEAAFTRLFQIAS